MSKQQKDNLPSADMVRKYLQENPDFLEDNPDILEILNISHNSGKAVSLVERQVGVMRDRNKRMSAQVAQMSALAKENSVLFEKTNRLVLSLIQAEDLSSLVKTLYQTLSDDFGTEFYSLTLINDSETELNTVANIVTREHANTNIGALLSTQGAVCGVIRDEEVSFLFGVDGSDIGSVVTVPLGNENIVGVLALGNRDAKFYSRDTGTLFITYVGELLNELLPKHMS